MTFCGRFHRIAVGFHRIVGFHRRFRRFNDQYLVISEYMVSFTGGERDPRVVGFIVLS